MGRAGRQRAWIALVGGVLALPPLLPAAAPVIAKPGPPASGAIRWIPPSVETPRHRVQVTGLDASTLAALRRTAPQWRQWFTVHAQQGDLFADIGLPPMLGTYLVEDASITFTPQFALTPGVTYRATFHPGRLPGGRKTDPPLTSTFKLVPTRTGPGTVVRHVHPSADVLPENLLKFYVHFSGPMSGGHIYDHIQLREESGRAVELPFLEIDEELWDPGMTRLTLFIDPGRIKRGVQPLEEIGPALEEGKRYTLSIDRAWKDAAGLPLKESFRKSFRVGPPARAPLDSAQWTIAAPPPGGRTALTVTFPAPMDHALAQRWIQVVRVSGESVEGSVTLEDQERRWSFHPAQPWERGRYHLLARTTLEDLAGNNIGKSFEVDVFESVQRRLTNAVVKIEFEVK